MALRLNRRALMKGAGGLLAAPYLSTTALAEDAIKLR